MLSQISLTRTHLSTAFFAQSLLFFTLLSDVLAYLPNFAPFGSSPAAWPPRNTRPSYMSYPATNQWGSPTTQGSTGAPSYGNGIPGVRAPSSELGPTGIGAASTFPLRFSSPASRNFYVDGSKLPFVEFDAGPSYAGLLPVSSDPNEKRKFFFWFWAANEQVGANDLTFWTNGGPGCSSLESMLQETGPISWKFGQARPTKNPFSWTNVTSMLYVEHPIGTGYSVGTPTATNQTDVARDLFGFFQQWLLVFTEMRGKNFWLSGESYAGYYVPYLADYIYKHQTALDLSLKGMFLANPTLSWVVFHQQMVVVPMVKQYEHVFAFNQTFLAQIEHLHRDCGYADYLAKYEVYPPPSGTFPLPQVGLFTAGQLSNYSCDTFAMVYDAAKLANPAFNVYQILDTPPSFWDVLDAPQRWPGMQGDAIYFNREDVKQALHVPTHGQWSECTRGVFPNGDQSLPPAVSILTSVIDRNARTVIASGMTDMVMINQGAKLVLQNLTWGQAQGFQKPITNDFIVESQGYTGHFATERGLTFVELEKSGHMVPQYQPKAALQILQYLLGQVNSPSARWPS